MKYEIMRSIVLVIIGFLMGFLLTFEWLNLTIMKLKEENEIKNNIDS